MIVPAFAGVGIEIEYMIVDAATLDVRPIADRLLRDAAGRARSDVSRGAMGWSNELALHVLEVKNRRPHADLGALAGAFAAEVAELERRLAAHGARLMPGAMHPWMEPRRETRLWPHGHAALYRRYDRLFDCRRHGWANLQSMHVNLPFADDHQFARLHAAVRLALPILPALAASSPFAERRFAGALDYRMEVYRHHQGRLTSTIGEVIPDTVPDCASYHSDVLEPMYRELADHDPEGVLRHEWLNARGAIARFDRQAIEIRVIDTQECPRADLAVAAATVHLVRRLYESGPLDAQQRMPTATLVGLLGRCIETADQAMIDETEYLALLGAPARACTAGALWRQLLGDIAAPPALREPLAVILEHGPLARRLLRAAGTDAAQLGATYRALCEALRAGHPFIA